MRQPLFFVVLCLFCLALSACSDEPLNQYATAFVSEYQARQNNATDAQKDSYYYLLGIGSQDDPLKTGKAYYDDLQVILAKQGDLEKSISDLNRNYDYINDLSSSIQKTDDISCVLTSDNQNAYQCFETLLHNDIDTTPYQLMHERYLTFLNNTPAVMLGTMRADIHFPDYRVLRHGQRVNLIHTLKTNPNHAMRALSQELALLRNHLANANSLIEKMIFADMVINQIQAMVFVKQQYPHASTDIIPPMTSDELSLKAAIIAEFMLGYEMYHHFEKEHGSQSELFYKKNRTINQSANFYQEAILLSQLSSPKFAAQYNDETKPPKTDYTNYIGSTLVNIALPDYRQYISRVKSLDNIIIIANHVMNNAPLSNHFAPTITNSQIQKTHICLQSPMSQNPNDNTQIGTEIEAETQTGQKIRKFECLNLKT